MGHPANHPSIPALGHLSQFYWAPSDLPANHSCIPTQGHQIQFTCQVQTKPKVKDTPKGNPNQVQCQAKTSQSKHNKLNQENLETKKTKKPRNQETKKTKTPRKPKHQENQENLETKKTKKAKNSKKTREPLHGPSCSFNLHHPTIHPNKPAL